jgi:hypothetical protein
MSPGRTHTEDATKEDEADATTKKGADKLLPSLTRLILELAL